MIGSGAIIGLVGLCYKISNGNVKRPECHNAMNSFNKRIEDLKDHIDTRFEDIKDFIKNGK